MRIGSTEPGRFPLCVGTLKRFEFITAIVDKGERIEDNKKVEVEGFHDFEKYDVQKHQCRLIACDEDVAPIYSDDPRSSAFGGF